ncbi:MAG: efflux RND transporter periplasmic adaptor subunit [Candidatus Magasanikbacteria bacterium]|nr:efflux RND transporter periplasmic adaptor subunit [Candidatus Magasanikbacteria bacterium]
MDKTILLAKLKRPRYYVSIAIAVLIVGYGTYSSIAAKNKPLEYETTSATKGNLTQTIEATGKLESKDGVDLRFEMPGTLTTISVKEGAQVKAGQVLASLRLSELNASLGQASANLRQKMAGATDQDRAYYKAALDSAQASWEQSQASALSDVANAKSAILTAEANLKLAEGGNNSKIISAAYENAFAAMQTAMITADDGLTQVDNILGVDNVSANDSFERSLSPANPGKIATAQNSYYAAKSANSVAKTKINSVLSASDQTGVRAGLTTIGTALNQTIKALSSVSDILETTIPTAELSQTTLDTKKSTIVSSRSALAAQYSATLISQQSLDTAANSYTNYQIAYNKAVSDLATIEVNSQSTVKIREAAYLQAKANYEGKTLPTREVDLAPYRAAVAIAAANRERAILRAPVDGVVGKIAKKKGELVSSADAVIQIVSPHFEIRVDVPETDIAKIVNSTRRDATFTLDAFGEETKFTGTIITVNQDSTEIQDVVYYQVTIAVADNQNDKPLQSGMTANVKIITDTRENVLFVPQRTLRTRENGEKFVRVLNEDKTEREATVTPGLRADDGKVEILSGLNEGETVIISSKQA